MSQPDLTGPDLEKREEVRDVKRALGKIGIFLEGFGITITGVYVKPRPYGFDFDCEHPDELLATARKITSLSEDKLNTREGSFSAGQTHGVGLREIGSGPRLHLEIALSGKDCNVHIDSHGYVTGQGEYDWNVSLEHGYWDLLSDKAPWMFGSFGDRGQVGPVVAEPVISIDGRTRLFFGLGGHW